MDEATPPPPAAGQLFAWMAEPETMRRFEAKDPTLMPEMDVASEDFFMLERRRQRAAGVSVLDWEKPRDEVAEAERCMGWLYFLEWQKSGEGRYERLHPATRVSFIRKYTLMISWVEDGAIDSVKDYGMSKEAAVALLREALAPHIKAQEEFERNPPKMPPIVEAYYRPLGPRFLG